jgi:hypothetical protein
MKPVDLTLCVTALVIIPAFAVPTQTPPASDNLPVEIISFQIGNNYNPLLERQPAVFPAESGDAPMSQAEREARRNVPHNRRNVGVIAPGGAPAKRPASVQVVDQAEWVKLTLCNTSDKTIKTLVWDFAFPRRAGEQWLLRYEVTSKAEIKPGGQKALKQKLPKGALKCDVVQVSGGKVLETVCSEEAKDPTQFPQVAVAIKRIEYADGTVWQRQDQ